jgi:hypothetical protein
MKHAFMRAALLALLFTCLPAWPATIAAPAPRAGAGPASGASASATQAAAAERLVRDFYKWYLGELNRGNWEPIRNRREALKYLTPEYRRRIPGLQEKWLASVIVCAQDWEESWATNFTVGRVNLSGAKATTVVRLPVKGGLAIKVKITLSRRAGEWRISLTECVN